MKGDAPFKGEEGGGVKERDKTQRLLYMMQNSEKTLKFRNLPLQDQRTNVNQTKQNQTKQTLPWVKGIHV